MFIPAEEAEAIEQRAHQAQLEREKQQYEKMTIEGKIFITTYDEMMSEHIPPPSAGDCSDEDLVSDLVREKYEAMSFKPECVMYNVDGPLVSGFVFAILCSGLTVSVGIVQDSDGSWPVAQ